MVGSLRTRVVPGLCVAVLGALLAVPGSMGSAGARTSPRSPDTPEVRPGANDLASIKTDRWIVQLAEPPAASYGGGIAGLGATAPAATGAARFDAAAAPSQAYVSHLRNNQQTFESTLTRVAKGARVERRYQTALNGMAVKMSATEAAAVRRLAGVTSVTPDVAYHLDMFSSPEQIGAPTLWNKVGGQANAGAGVKVAVIDSGIYVANPCFDDTGYTAPAGFPRGDTRFTNNKVIAARTYFRPDDPPVAGSETPIPGPLDSPHGTHTSGTVACNADTDITFQETPLTISGIAPRAYLMNYKVFYASGTPEDFQNGNAYVAELVQAIDDAVADGADVMNNSWGSSYQNTLAWPDPMVQAAEAATDAGVVMVFSAGNAGPGTATIGGPANSPKVISVGATTKDQAISPGFVDVTGPAPVPEDLTNSDVGAAEFGEQSTEDFGPAPYTPAQAVASNDSTDGCSLANGDNPFPDGSLDGQIALIERGTCEFSDKVANAELAGAVAAFIYNSEAGGDNLQSIAAGVRADEVTIRSWFLRRSDGLGMVAFHESNPTATAQFRSESHPAVNIGDVVAGFSSRGPTQDKTLKPDVAAPGVDIVSSGYATGDYPANVAGFGSSSGTSMAGPHVAGSAALLVQQHPRWLPGQVKSALMSTANETVFNDTANTPAGVLDRGAGRIDLTKAGNPGLTFDSPSVSAGELAAGQGYDTAIVTKNVSGSSDTWDVSTTTSSPDLKLSVSSSWTLAKGASSAKQVHVTTVSGTEPGDYEGSVVLVSQRTGRRLHIPVWLRVIPTAHVADVLLVDDDGSGFGAGPDYAPYYKKAFRKAGIDFKYIDVSAKFFPTFNELFGYSAVVMFTGDNASFDTSGLFPEDQDALAEWLDSGGRFWALGQNFAETSDSNADFESEHLGRARLYHGYLGLRYDVGSVFAGQPPRPSVDGDASGPWGDLHLDLSAGADGAGNQTSIEGTSALGDTDTFNAADTMVPFASPRGGLSAQSKVAWGRASEPSLDESRLQFRYRSSAAGFGLEGLNTTTGGALPQTVVERTIDWLLDTVTASLNAPVASPGDAASKRLVAHGDSSVGASIVRYRWDFGDGSPWATTTKNSVDHEYAAGNYVLRVEVTDSLGHRTVTTRDISI